MSKRKRVSADEKRSRMLGFFHEKKEFFSLNELEKILPTETGIIMQAVKDVLQDLVDNGLVASEKIGSSIYFWSFPGEKIPRLQAQNAEAGTKILMLESRLQQVQAEIASLESIQEDTEEKEALIRKVRQMQAKEAEMKIQISKFSDSDPEIIKSIIKKAESLKEQTNTWTDNIYAIQSWCRNKFGIEDEKLNKQFNIPEDLDYVT